MHNTKKDHQWLDKLMAVRNPSTPSQETSVGGGVQGGEADKKPVPTQEFFACPPVFLYVPSNRLSSQRGLAILPLRFSVESSLVILLGQGRVTFTSTGVHSTA